MPAEDSPTFDPMAALEAYVRSGPTDPQVVEFRHACQALIRASEQALRSMSVDDEAKGRPFRELRDTGLLWLINTSVLHPRGYALALHLDENGQATGWSLLGDGSEAWTMGEDPEGPSLDELMARTKRLMP